MKVKYSAKLELTADQIESILLAKKQFKIDENSHSFKKAILKILSEWKFIQKSLNRLRFPSEPVIVINEEEELIRILPDGTIERLGKIIK